MKIGDESDDVLVRRAREGDHEAFAGLVDRYKRGIANFIGGAVKNAGDVADLTQDTFLRAYAHLGTFNPALGRFSTWIYQIARNVVRTHLGKSSKRLATHSFPEDQTLENSVPDLSRDADPPAACCVKRPNANFARRSPICRSACAPFFHSVTSITWNITRSPVRSGYRSETSRR